MPSTMGVFILLIIILSFIAGSIRGEMILTLTGAALFAVWIYCLVITLLLALFHFRRARRISIRLSPEKLVCGDRTQVSFYEDNELPSDKKVFQLPGILIRCRIILNTKDKRRIVYDFKPEYNPGSLEFQATLRGAYYSDYDEYAIFDILGFFRFAFRLPAENNARLLAAPFAANQSLPVSARGGETNRQDAPPTERTDILIDHRPYIPGDDPRRINWKLYSHGGELFIRQGEREPPPHSNLTILIDTQFDELYSLNAARYAVDLLCENALAIINHYGKDKDVQIGFTGGEALSGIEPGFSLAFPAAFIDNNARHDLPSVPEDRAILILALPRATAFPSALDRFITNNANRLIELIFVYGTDDKKLLRECAEAAEINVRLYNNRSGVRARAVEVI